MAIDDATFDGADVQLVARVRAGEDVAFRELFVRYRRLVYSIALRMLDDPNEADDICQEVFLTVHRRIDTLRDPERLRSWLCRITLTRTFNAERASRRRGRDATVSLEQWLETPTRKGSPTANPDRALASAETRRRLDEALTALPFAYRTVVILRDIEGLSYDEIAEAVDANLGTVKSRLARGRMALREQLRDLLGWQREVIP